MKLFLAMDLRQNLVVHGKSGQRETYKPLDWGFSPTAEPIGFVKDHQTQIISILPISIALKGPGPMMRLSGSAHRKSDAVLLTGVVIPRLIFLTGEHIVNIVGTETGGRNLSRYHGGCSQY